MENLKGIKLVQTLDRKLIKKQNIDFEGLVPRTADAQSPNRIPT